MNKYKNLIVVSFFACFLLIGLYIFRDYGVTWDDPLQRSLGNDTFDYVTKANTDALFSKDYMYHGPTFEILLVLEEKLLGVKRHQDTRLVYFSRHLTNFLFFYLSTIFFYLLLSRYLLNNWKYALLGTVFLVLSPRIFADSFFNTKDIPCLAMFIINIYALIRYLDNRTYPNAIILSVLNAYFIDIRLVGLLVTYIAFIFLSTDLIIKRNNIAESLISFPVYLFSLMFFIVLFWPFLWYAPSARFIESYSRMMHYPWHGSLLYMGKFFQPYVEHLPWHYIPVWILITTPILYTLCFFVGFINISKYFIINPKTFYLSRRNDIIISVWFLAPIISGIVLKSVFYDAWRHMFFIYPAFISISVIGLKYIFDSVKLIYNRPVNKIVQIICVLVVTYSLFNTAQFMIINHPFQNVYFNRFAGNNIKNNFDLDYWGLSYRQALEYILKTDKSSSIKVKVANLPGQHSYFVLDNNEKKRLKYVDKIEDAKYYLSEYRGYSEEYPFNEYYSIKANNLKIMAVFKMKGG